MFHPGLKGRAQTVVAAGTGSTPAAFYLGLCCLRGILSLPAPPRRRCRRAILLCSNDGAASIPKFGPEIKNRCSLWAVLEGFLASILKSGLEIKNRCTQKVVFGEILASIRKFGPEIKNRCTKAAHPPARVHHALTTRLALDILHGHRLDSGSTVVRQWRRKRVLMRPEAAFSYVFAAEGAQHPPKKPPRSTTLAAAPGYIPQHKKRG